MNAAKVAWRVLSELPRPLLAASAAGWLLLLALREIAPLPQICGAAAGADDTARLTAALTLAPAALVLEWLIMILAMMSPSLAPASLHVWSFSRSRLPAVGLFVLGYALVWLAAGIPLLVALLALGDAARSAGVPLFVLAGAVALAWHACPLKQLCLNGCHRRPKLAEKDALLFGARHGTWCVGTCWALTLLPFAAPGAFHGCSMAVVMFVLLVERARAPEVPRWRVG